MQKDNNYPSFGYPTNSAHDNDNIIGEDGVLLNNMLHIFWLRRFLFLCLFILIFVIGMVFLSQITPRYTTETKVLIGLTKKQVVNVEAVLTGDLSTDSAIKSEIEVLGSKELAKKVITKLNLISLPEFNPTLEKKKGFFADLLTTPWILNVKDAIGLTKNPDVLTKEEQQERLMSKAVEIYLSKGEVKAVKGSQVISLSYTSTDPKLAALIANTHIENYIIGQLQAKFDATQKATSWLNDQLSGLREKVENSEKAVEIYRNQHGLSQGKDKGGLAGEQLSEINSQLIIAKAEKAGAAARLAQVTQLLHGANTEIETASEVLSSPLIQKLREQEAELERKVSEMSVEYGAKHPKLIRINAEILDLRGKIRGEIGKIAAGLRNELNVASSREASLEGSLRASEQKSGASHREEVQLHALEREAHANRTLFETFLNRFKETSSTQGMEEADARVISEAEVPISPSYPRKNMLTALILIFATIISSTVILVLEVLNPGFRTPEEIERFLGLPTIGLIPQTQKKIVASDYILTKPSSHVSEAINSLRVSLMLSDPDNDVKSIVITSSIPAEGKSTLALCLGRSAAQAGQKVILIDTDFRRPTLEQKLGLSTHAKGLTDLILSHNDKVADFMFKDEKSNLYIMPKGQAEYANPVDIFSSHRMEALLQAMKDQFDLIIFDSPPVMVVSDARVLAKLVDKTVYVVAWDKTPRKFIKAGLEQLRRSEQISVAGIVLQQVNLKLYSNYSNSGYYYYGKYGQYYVN